MKPTARRLRIYVPAVPVAQPRPRAFSMGKSARIVSAPDKHPVNAFKAAVAYAARQTLKEAAPLTGPLAVRLEFVMPRPKAKCWKTKPMPREPHTITPDADNLAKSVLDAASRIVWRDDSQIFDLRVVKHIAAGDESPSASIEVDYAE